MKTTDTDTNANTNTPAAKAAATTNARFIELLNLCVDDQLTPSEAAELDAALLASPARRRTYEQYCRMTEACAQLFQHDSATAATPALARALARAERKIQAARAASRAADARPFAAWWRALLAFGGLATLGAAAAIALLLHTRAPDAPRNDASIAATATNATATDMGLRTPDSGLRMRNDTNAAAATAAANAPAADMTADTAEVQTAKPLQPFSPSVLQPFQGKRFHFPKVTTFTGDNPRALAPDDSAIAWTKDVQLRPIHKVNAADAIESLTRIVQPQITSTTFVLPAPAPAPEDDADEMTAFQYHK